MKLKYSEQNRDTYFDLLKFILIIFVIAGHCLARGLDNRLNLAVYNTIYSFHMPLFVFISGYFTKIGDKRRFWNGILKLLETLFVFQLIRNIPDILCREFSLVAFLLIPKYTLWYLYSIILWKLILYVIPDKIRNNIRLIWIAFILSLLAGFIPIGQTLSFQRTFVFLPFFIMGYYCATTHFDLKKIYFNKAISIVLLLTTSIFMWMLNHPMKYVLFGSFPYDQMQTNYFLVEGLIMRFVQLLAAIVICLSLMSIIDKTKISKRFCSEGRKTLLYYLLHSFAVQILGFCIPHFNLPTNIVAMGIYITMIYVCLYYISKLQCINYLLNPVSTLKNKWNNINN